MVQSHRLLCLRSWGKSSKTIKMDVFLESVLKENYKKIPIRKEGSQRIYTRIQCENTSWMLVESPISEQALFTTRLKELAEIGLNVPAIKAQDDKQGFLLLEDLGDQDLETVFSTHSEKRIKYYKQAIDQMLLLQRKAQHLKWPRFTQEQLFQEMLWTKEHLMEDLLNKKYNENSLKECLKEWQSISQQLACSPYVPAHRDYHSRNLMLKNQKLYWIDFQSAGLFPRYYDAVSLLYDPYVDMSDKERSSLIEYFINGCTNSNSTNEFIYKKFSKEEWQICAIQRLFKACGSFAGFTNLKNQNSHLKYLSPALHQLTLCLESIQHFPVFLQLVKELKTQVEENKEIKGVYE